jgi:two-component system chemotaxis sensor kinase CheA
MTLNFSIGKYRALLLAIVLFLVIDIGVLAFNVMASHEIERDASEINSAGELRMVSQQLAKSLLTLENEIRKGLQTQTSLAQILESSDEFDLSLATLQDSRQGFFTRLFANNEANEERNRLLKELDQEWQPLGREVRKLLEKKEVINLDDVLPVSNKSVSRNLKLLQLSDDLTQQMEEISRGKTTDIRTIQLTAFILAFLNFIFIVFRFIRQLNQSDRRAEAAQEETKQILDTVHQGLFLLHADGRIGDQRSASLEILFGRTLRPQLHFVDEVLKHSIKDEDLLETASGYISTLFDKKIKPSLLARLNPLVEIEIDTPSDKRQQKKYLSFAFEQVKKNDEVTSLLVSVIDVSQAVLLQRELSGVEARAKSEIEMLIGVIDQDPELLQEFIKNAKQRIEQINGELQNVRAEAGDYTRVVKNVGRCVHSIKGEASLLGVGVIEQYAHELEDRLSSMRGNNSLSGEDLIAVAVGASELLDRISSVEGIVSRIARFATRNTEQEYETHGLSDNDPLTSVVEVLKQLGAKVANDLNKEIYFEVDFPPVKSVPEQLIRICQEVLPQLIRNAIVHGIETEEDRQLNGKQLIGHVLIRFEFEGSSGYRIRVRDDGAGLSLSKLRQHAVESGEHSEFDVLQMHDHQLISMLFEPGFTTQEKAHLHAGRGDGLAVVREVLATIGAGLRILSTPSAFTEFIIYKKA